MFIVETSLKQRARRGQSMVEFALAIPFLLLVLLGIVYFGKYFYVAQNVVYAAQEGARMAARVPNLKDPSVRDAIRGFTTDGALVGVDDATQNPSPIYCALSAAKMLSGDDGAHGNLPGGAEIKILPYDDNAPDSGTVTVQIKFPFGLMLDYRSSAPQGEFGNSVDIVSGATRSETPVSFANLSIQQSASATHEIYQD